MPRVPSPPPDILLPGHKPVQHELVLEWPADAGWRFAASPVAGLHGCTQVAPGEPFSFSSKYGTRIFAIPAGATAPAADATLKDVTWASVPVPIAEISSVPAGQPLARVVTTLRVVGVTSESITFERVREVRFDANGANSAIGAGCRSR